MTISDVVAAVRPGAMARLALCNDLAVVEHLREGSIESIERAMRRVLMIGRGTVSCEQLQRYLPVEEGGQIDCSEVASDPDLWLQSLVDGCIDLSWRRSP